MAGVVLADRQRNEAKLFEFLGADGSEYINTGAPGIVIGTLKPNGLTRLVTQYKLRFAYAERSVKGECDGEVSYIGNGAVTSLSVWGIFDETECDYPFWFWSSFVQAQIRQRCYTVYVACPADITEPVYTVPFAEAWPDTSTMDRYYWRTGEEDYLPNMERVNTYLRQINEKRAELALGYPLQEV